MFDIGFFELALIALLALIVLGPERLPRAARTAGLWLGRIKRSVSGIQQEISAQLEAEELRQTLSEQKKQLDETLAHARNEARDVENSIAQPTSPADPVSSVAKAPSLDKASAVDKAPTVDNTSTVLPTPESSRPAGTGKPDGEPDAASITSESREPRS
ncbi:Sec-independent protein translocase protein TatB [Cobetia crustatorum]|uniref:Sec-independent protein translocase protein TatB n=1 Tax=Cobetia crustatorum TaxID=553385 RepID=UPI00046AFD39|nr:Sec-independent protein translocase protein TatB [Cobetia crustatorum]